MNDDNLSENSSNSSCIKLLNDQTYNIEGSETSETSQTSEKDSKKNDGFADMVKKILEQKVDAVVPLLSKRKTPLMKEIEGDHDKKDQLKKLRLDRKVQKEKQMHLPDQTTADFERQLRKLATRGVISLFNAIAKTKRDEVALNIEDSKQTISDKKKTDPNKNLMDMLKFQQNSKKKNSSNSQNISLIPSSKLPLNSLNDNKWSVLKEDFMINKNMSLKNWDHDKDDDELEDD